MSAPATYPVRVDASLDPRLSRWLWLVKWILAIPHYLVLALLWIAFAMFSVAAFFGILFTGRYPRAIFDFNVGVMRWSWRVAYYAYAALGTDRYPPFTLAEVPGYPAHLEIGNPDHLSRGLVLVKWWLLAIPHYIIAGLFVGGGMWVTAQTGDQSWAGPGLIGLLVLVAAVILAFTGRYPKTIFDFVLGMNRWVLRVAAYAGLMTDRYPPFRLDMGGHEPGGTLTVPGDAPVNAPEASPGDPPESPAAETAVISRWTAGRIVSVVVGSVLALTSTGVLAGAGTLLWADQTQRQDGYLTSYKTTLGTSGHALATEQIDLGNGTSGWLDDVVGDVRVRVTSDTGKPVFVGIAPTDATRSYLAGVRHSIVTDTSGPRYALEEGGAPTTAPEQTPIWDVQASGAGTQTLVWPAGEGRWTIVAMNADGSAGVTVDADIGATVPALEEISWGLLIGGVVFLAGGIALIVVPIRGASRGPTTG